jgi:hypothetical protein
MMAVWGFMSMGEGRGSFKIDTIAIEEVVQNQPIH